MPAYDMDALSDVLRAVKLTGAVFFNAECKAPWCLRSPPSERLRVHIGAASSHVIEFHFVTQGRGYIKVGEESTPLLAGDIVMLPHGDEHLMGNGIATEIIDGEASIPNLNLKGGEIGSSRIGGSGEPTNFICGFLVCDARLIQPILAGLPRALRVHIRADAAGEWLENIFQNAVSQAVSVSAGSEIVVARLAEVLFAETLRRYLLQLPEGRTGWLAGAGDSSVSRVLAACHRDPARAWTLETLAEEAGLSRSALTERFARYLGQSPIAYLTDWRLELAAESLRTTSRSVLQIALCVGYDSEAAFNRAFKRKFGIPPARYRKTARDEMRARTAPELSRVAS